MCCWPLPAACGETSAPRGRRPLPGGASRTLPAPSHFPHRPTFRTSPLPAPCRSRVAAARDAAARRAVLRPPAMGSAARSSFTAALLRCCGRSRCRHPCRRFPRLQRSCRQCRSAAAGSAALPLPAAPQCCAVYNQGLKPNPHRRRRRRRRPPARLSAPERALRLRKELRAPGSPPRGFSGGVSRPS